MIRILDTPEAVYRAAAWQWMKAALDGAPGIIGLATGTTTTPIHKIITELYAAQPFDTARLSMCAVDDYVGIPEGNIAGCGERVRRQLVRPLGLSAEQVLLPDTFHGEDAPEKYERAIEARGGIKLQILGLGRDGHIGFNYPGTPLNSTAHNVTLPQSTKDTLKRLYALPEERMPTLGLTLGIRSIMMSKAILVAVTGRDKAQTVADALRGPVSERMPASVLQLHRDVLWLLDEEAASLL